jgi:glyoxylase-like metal-dependent hydrolase (beta-lactamase superfamily II)
MNITSDPLHPIAPGLWGKKDVFVNYYFIKEENSGEWFLVDTGLKWSASRIRMMAEKLFGKNTKPAAIILTHGHFDHVGGLRSLLELWPVPVYAHPLEIPYLAGKSSYPPADPNVGGGMMSSMAWMYPRGPIDVHPFLKPIPANNKIPGLHEWSVIETPGHSPGHISLFREKDRVLIAGDAVVTTKQESAIHALSYIRNVSGPPKYMTCNWASAKISVAKIAGLNPSLIATGHGHPMEGEEMRHALVWLASHFDRQAMPEKGRYVNEPAVTTNDGVLYLPPRNQRVPDMIKVIAISAAVLSIAWIARPYFQKKKLLV